MIRKPSIEADPSLASRFRGGGLLLVGGPPFGGKSLLASRLAEVLPYAVKLEAVDNLARPTERWYPYGPTCDALTRPASKMLSAAQSIWWEHGDDERPAIIVCARFESPGMRRRACGLARRMQAPFLFVEARSSNVRALRRLSRMILEPSEMERRIGNYERAIGRYQRVDGRERSALPCVLLGRVSTDLDAAVDKVLVAWATRRR
ncbi:hypothetical protein [Haliangium sp.]|uniref:hypothetical protein n=1 Tax=Haliangium sp. TaxID=2663208 RepID=UPI003D0EF893